MSYLRRHEIRRTSNLWQCDVCWKEANKMSVEWNGADPKECAWAEREIRAQRAEREFMAGCYHQFGICNCPTKVQTGFIAGWRYFWDIVERPRMFLLGFFVAVAAVDLVVTSLVEIAVKFVKGLW